MSRLEALHHITMITGDARNNVDFYADTLGLRLVKKTVNFDAPEVYHLYFGDERGSPGSILTWFEFPGAVRGRAGEGMIHLIQLAVADEAALEFWAQRLQNHGYPTRLTDQSLRFEDYDGLAFELVVSTLGNPPLQAAHPAIPPEHAILGVDGARAYVPASTVGEPEPLLTETLGFSHEGGGEYLLAGERRSVRWGRDPAPEAPGIQGAGTVHHIAWACRDADQLTWQQRVREAGRHVTDVLDRDYFTSIYFREPNHVLFEIATLSPGFAVDEDSEHLGEALKLPKQHEHLRAQLERSLTPLENPRASPR
jgi:glyoxalase family protein